MKKRLLLIAAITATVICAIVLILALLPAMPAITKANFDRLEIGMNQSKVESIFGGKSSDTVHLKRDMEFITISFDGPKHQGWQGVDGFAMIQFNEQGQIEKMNWGDQPTTFRQKLQRRFPWLPD